MKVYLATSGEYSDYRVRHVFAREEDAEAYALGDGVEEFEVREWPVEVRAWHELTWHPSQPDRERSHPQGGNPQIHSAGLRDFDGDERHAEHTWSFPQTPTLAWLRVGGWDLGRVKKVYSEQRAQYLARKEGIA